MRSGVLTRTDRSVVEDIHLRLDVLEKRGSYFRDPVTSFFVAAGPAQLGTRIQFKIYLTTGIQWVEILRNTSRDFGNASVLQTYSVQELTVNKPITYYDHDKAIVGLTTYYWIRVIPNPGKFKPITHGPLSLPVAATMDTSLHGANMPINITNNATVDSIDAGSSATVRVYGPGGVGMGWTANKGAASTAMVAGTITGLSYATQYWVYWNGSSYQAATAALTAIADNFTFVGIVVTISSASSTTAVGTAGFLNGNVVGANITNGGTGYTSPPAVSISGGGGSNATAVAQIANGKVVSVFISNAGSGYTSNPSLVFSGGQSGISGGGAPAAPLPPAAVGGSTRTQLPVVRGGRWADG